MDRATPPPLPVFIGRDTLRGMMDPDHYLAAVEAAFRAHAEGRTRLPMPLHIEAEGGGFHGKGALVVLDRPWVAVKVNSNFPSNGARGLPTIQGAVLLYDGEDGRLVAILDSIEITARRTAAASALAVRYLARDDTDTIALVGCGAQAEAQLAALVRVRCFRRAFVWDDDTHKARHFADAVSKALALPMAVGASLRDATHRADVVVTCTTARSPILGVGDVRPGTFIAAVGADAPHKSEIAPALMARATVVVDSLEQACAMGDLHQAIEAGVMTRGKVHAELADLVAGRKPGRENEDEITVFDSTGLGIQDVAASVAAYQRLNEGKSPCNR
jgi:ornithine cyclodeaminase/alanine dehydrogenase-like protein (mu-crystallin family)